MTTIALADLGPKVRADLLNIATYIARDNPTAAISFLDAVQGTLDDLVLHPRMGRLKIFKNSRIAPCRTFSVRSFPNYLIFYKLLFLNAQDENEQTFLVVRVLHAARDIDSVL